MCGIGGILKITRPGEKHEPIPEAWLDALDEAIKWRGTDGAGRFRDRVTKPDGSIVEVALVHRRLSIIDIEGGGQPFVIDRCPRCAALAAERWMKEHGRSQGMPEPLLALVFNGCIYNHRELRHELEALGHVFASDHSDTEVIAHAWAEWSTGARQRFDGMFTFGLWDRELASVVIARDRFGEKPLYIAQADVTTSFSSSFPAIEFLQSVGRHESAIGDLDAASLADWVALGYDATGTPRLDACQVPPGSMVDATEPIQPQGRGRRSLRSQAASPAAPILTPEELQDLISEGVRTRLDADVPIGVFLSGGIDSSLVAFHAHKHLGRVTTACVRMPDERYDESHHAAAVARAIGTDHHTIDPATSAADNLLLAIRTIGMPFGDSSIIPTMWLCRAMRSEAKVALSGDGGDELFGGYMRYRAAQMIRLPAFAMLAAMFFPEDVLNRADPKGSGEQAARLIVAIRNRGYSDLAAIFPSPDFFRLTTPRSLRLGRSGSPGPTFNRRRYGGANAARQFDIENYLPGDLLRKVDTASMLNHLEVRCPLLSPVVANRALATPWRLLCPKGKPKGLLRAAAQLAIPKANLDRPKQGFAIPISDWWRTDFGGLGTLLFDYLDKPQPFGKVHDVLPINMDYVRQMIDEHWAAGGLTPKYTTRHVRRRDHGQRLFALVSLAIWAENLERSGRSQI